MKVRWLKRKASIILSARTTYSDWILKMLNNIQLQNSSASFNDIQGLITLDPNDKNSFSLSGYVSNDNFDYYKESAFSYRNFASTLKWKHTFSPRLSAQFSAVISNYSYQLNSIQDSTTYSSLILQARSENSQG